MKGTKPFPYSIGHQAAPIHGARKTDLLSSSSQDIWYRDREMREQSVEV